MKTPMHCGWVALGLAALVAAAPAPARASESDAFENKIEPISGLLYAKTGRFEITPTAILSIDDPFFSKFLFGVKLGYHLTEYWSVHGSISTGSTNPTGSTTICPSGQPCRQATEAELYGLPGRIKTMGGLELAFSPVYGKLNLIAQQVVHFDVSVMAGGDYFGLQSSLDSSAIGGHLGVGVRLFFAGFMALRLELKGYLYPQQIADPQPHKQLQRQLMAEMGLSFFFPTSPRSNR